MSEGSDIDREQLVADIRAALDRLDDEADEDDQPRWYQ